MSQITFQLKSKSEDPDNKACTGIWALGDKKIIIEFNDSKDAFNVDSLLRLAENAGYNSGKEAVKQLISAAVNQV